MLEQSFEEFQTDFIKKYDEYHALHKELNRYRGKDLGNVVEEVNEIIEKIQMAYNELFPGIVFVRQRHPEITALVRGFDAFIDDLKKAGAVEISGQHVAR